MKYESYSCFVSVDGRIPTGSFHPILRHIFPLWHRSRKFLERACILSFQVDLLCDVKNTCLKWTSDPCFFLSPSLISWSEREWNIAFTRTGEEN
ncbi:hypothetical protein AVEN_79706-1 [Araneus ventricosus]|uniref:Uncharacterized protein n=1 Tax=Araneus ventricosus TaxID=182803 RepID=A0A4Y2DF12_ARAVE|nr:hypothetical protein AVEN_100954-1 [Araneus ventricosus]GBM14135.1 hypothetical protein AVEN_79706-1 [Araneus ventricosus]